MRLTQNEELVLLAIDGYALERSPCKIDQISLMGGLSPAEARLICRRLLGKGLLSFVNPGDGETYVELTSIGNIHVRQIIQG